MLFATLTSWLVLAVFNPNEAAMPPNLPYGLDMAPWEHLWVDGCEEELQEAGYVDHRFVQYQEVTRATRFRGYDDMYCYVPQAVMIETGVTGVRYGGYTKFNCTMALALARFERIAQDEAEKIWGGENPIRWITHLGTYTCRRLRAAPEVQSQHSFGNAIDIEKFYVRGYGIIELKRHWEPTYPVQEPASQFLKSLSARLVEEDVFTNVLDPTYDAFHANHFHLDMAEPEQPGLGFFDIPGMNLNRLVDGWRRLDARERASQHEIASQLHDHSEEHAGAAHPQGTGSASNASDTEQPPAQSLPADGPDTGASTAPATDDPVATGGRLPAIPDEGTPRSKGSEDVDEAGSREQ